MIQVFTNTSIIESNHYFHYIYQYIAQNSVTNFIIIFSVFIFLFYVIKLIFSIKNAKLMAKLTSNLYIDISKKLFENYLNYYYRDFGKKNTAEINQILIVESDYLSLMVSNIIYLLIHLTIIGLLYTYMMYTDWFLTILVTTIFILLAYMYKKLLSLKLVNMGEERMIVLNDYIRFVKSTFSNYKFIKGLTGEYIDTNLSHKTTNYKKARIDMLFWSETPRLILEFFVIATMIGILLFIKLRYQNTDELLVVVSAYALALFRMLPSLSRVLNGVNIINMYKKTLDMVHTEFVSETEKKQTDLESVVLKNHILLQDISFTYPDSDKKSLVYINVEIKKGDKIAFVGESGSGKSTLMDILIGLHLPTNGKFIVDDTEINSKNIVSWRKNTSFVPQKVVLFESSVKENITFGKEYDEKLFKEVLEDVYMYDTVMAKGGIEVKVGDEVSGFSGGQMQRLAFARALYQERDILFLDEATSSLDEEIENQIVDKILNKYREKTIIAIVHKESIADKFDRIIRLKDGYIAEK
ncbi:ATP-binding cassette domain-containing protein [Aliarcobacter cryaerophilus]|uniref:ATP-binding cassette domain-containing protein n=1 Tax=Aliarcobacter cryaerophilus TaxID=28198 RepID=UPI0021B31999|nr:ABC transporter ATP-binding protein [Aliarcobacter cryaerophilus]MCT7511865.1 ABC transporter ATP-binding protein/permease [Aliarcobacter cryaerophilus]